MLVRLTRKANIEDVLTTSIVQELPTIVGGALSKGEKPIAPDTVEIHVRDVHPMAKVTYDIEIDVYASSSLIQGTDPGGMVKNIIADVKKILPDGITGCVELWWLPSSFGEFQT